MLHWSVHTFLGYLLMLAVMTYNVYINVALVLGGCLGYWIFGPKLIELNLKEFYKRQNILDCDKECAGMNLYILYDLLYSTCNNL